MSENNSSKNNQLISVIVPVYNVDKYLHGCIDSLLAQTHKNIEIIIVNDGSTDNSGAICDQYASEHNNIKVFHKQNNGVSSTRNLGLANATGDYIAFLDSDDIVSPDMYESLLFLCKENNTKISACGIQIHHPTKTYDRYLPNENQVISNQTALEYTIRNNGFFPTPVNKLFSKSVVDNIRFDEDLHMSEDYLFLVEAILSCHGDIAYTKNMMYHYMKREGSASHGFTEKKLTALTALEKSCGLLAQLSNRLVNLQRAYIVLYIAGMKIDMSKSQKKTHRKLINRYTKKHIMPFLSTKDISTALKIKGMGAIAFPGLAKRLHS